MLLGQKWVHKVIDTKDLGLAEELSGDEGDSFLMEIFASSVKVLESYDWSLLLVGKQMQCSWFQMTH